jgi:dihydropteroate synthase
LGILNLTPDSFSDGGKFNNETSAMKHAEQLLKEGAELLILDRSQHARMQSFKQ